LRRIDLATENSSEIDSIVLDAGPLGRLSSPKRHTDIINWLDETLAGGVDVYVSEVADYEVRRNLLLHGKYDSVRRLEELTRSLIYLPITTSVMLKAAELWAFARRRGRPTADLKELDCDVILAAQALEQGAIVATENLGHLSQFVTSRLWSDIKLI